MKTIKGTSLLLLLATLMVMLLTACDSQFVSSSASPSNTSERSEQPRFIGTNELTPPLPFVIECPLSKQEHLIFIDDEPILNQSPTDYDVTVSLACGYVSINSVGTQNSPKVETISSTPSILPESDGTDDLWNDLIDFCVDSEAEKIEGNSVVIIDDLIGRWMLDINETEKRNIDNLFYIFGTGIQHGYGMELFADGTFRWWIAIGRGGYGTYTVINDTIYVSGVTFEGSMPFEMEIMIGSSFEGSMSLVMTSWSEFDGQNFYYYLVWTMVDPSSFPGAQDSRTISALVNIFFTSYMEMFDGIPTEPAYWLSDLNWYELPWDREILVEFDTFDIFHSKDTALPQWLNVPVSRILPDLEYVTVDILRELFGIGICIVYQEGYYTINSAPRSGPYSVTVQFEGLIYEFKWSSGDTYITYVGIWLAWQ